MDMHSIHRLAVALCLALLGCAGTDYEPTDPASAPEAPPQPPARAHIELQVKPLPELYFEIRAQAADLIPTRPALAEAVRAWDPVKAEVGTFGGFWRFDLAGLLSRDPAEFWEWMEQYPESIRSRSGGSIPLRAPGEALATGIESAWPHFLAATWPKRKRALEGIRHQLEEVFMPEHREALAYMLEALVIEDPGLAVPVYLVTHSHPPGATTYRSRSGPVVVLSTSALLLNGQISDLQETILHETCHTLDAASDGETDAFSTLRRLLAEAGVAERDPRMHDIPHLLMFVQSEETMRRFYDRNHRAYGDSTRGDIAPLYERSGPAADITRRHWRRFLDHEITRDEALELIVRESLAAG